LSQPDDNFTNDRASFHQLMEQWLESSFDADQQAALLSRLKEHPEEMRRFVEANVRDQMLRDAARGLMLLDQVNEVTSSLQQPQRRSLKQIITVVASLAACLLVALFLFQKSERREAAIETFVSVASLYQTDSLLQNGDRLGSRTIEIQRGFIHLQFDDGVEVTLQGPARYELIGPGNTRLHTGLLTATVPPGAEGFQVSTATADVVDLGTAFGIEIDAEGIPEVSVFDGEVEVIPTNRQGKRLLQEGEAVRVNQRHEIETSPFDAVAFEKVWPVASGVAGSTGAFQFAPHWPRPMGLVQSDTDIFVLPEGYAQLLNKPLGVNITAPGKVRVAAELSPSDIPAGTRVKSFLLQFKPLDLRDDRATPPNQPNPDELARIVGEITFDRPVFGLIVVGDDLRASDGLFSKRGGQFPQKGRALELSGTPRDDTVTLSEDRRTVKLDLAAHGAFGDQVRVIVDQSLKN
jgi:hypothetical protein